MRTGRRRHKRPSRLRTSRKPIVGLSALLALVLFAGVALALPLVDADGFDIDGDLNDPMMVGDIDDWESILDNGGTGDPIGS